MKALADSDIVDRLRRIRLPAVPQVLAKLLELCRQENMGLPELATLIRQDPGLTVRILEVASSAMFRRRETAMNLKQSLMAIGTNMVKTIVISEAVFQAFGPLGRNSAIDLRHFWAHSLHAAVAAREIAMAIGYQRVDEAYLAGLLHDVGRLALLAAAPEQYSDHFHLPDDESLIRDETDSLGLTHAEAGAWLAEQWRLESFVADAIRYHHEHETRLVSTHPLLRIVALAHHMPRKNRGETRVLAAAALLGLKAGPIEQIEQQTRIHVDQLARHVGIDPAALADASPRLPPVFTAPDPAVTIIQNQMRDMALSQELSRCLGHAEDSADAPRAVTRAATVLFGFTRAAILQMDKADRVLRCVSATEADQRLAEFTMPLSATTRLNETLLRREVTYLAAAEGSLSIFEDQLVRVLDCTHLVTLPIVDGEGYYGILVGAADAALALSLTHRVELLRLFGEHAGAMLRERTRETVSAPVPNTLEDREIVRGFRQAAREIAHEVNNPLSIIRNYLSVLERKIEKKQSVSQEIAILQEEIDRVSDLVGGLSNVEPAAKQAGAHPAAIVHDVVTMLRESEMVPSGVRLLADTIDPALQVACDRGMLKQIFLNLLRNAVEAIGEEGTVQVCNDGFTSRENILYLSITVRDDGTGIPPQVLERLFQPVETTKGSEHRGLGLSIVHGLIRKIGGQIYCQSSREGTSFELLLPLSPLSGRPATALTQGAS
ncbi:HDOD domain-containing protein [Noviherbaspirillum aridicola]|uniref:histidine kinase n=1 Tax=Noviherbaspirillum aridicola TaxID=2849687 RepID=A0ABQ4Q5L9_9BURK|nr:HDOD domain-containing protein [Noviherbaspirillum aridicola]GIZ52497.1 hypothetical protein NCCP691_25110 [Noviherbaspirillum aridicola]